MKFASRAVHQVRGRFCLPTRVNRTRVGGQDSEPLLPPRSMAQRTPGTQTIPEATDPPVRTQGVPFV
jgi:hypothetical protein